MKELSPRVPCRYKLRQLQLFTLPCLYTLDSILYWQPKPPMYLAVKIFYLKNTWIYICTTALCRWKVNQQQSPVSNHSKAVIGWQKKDLGDLKFESWKMVLFQILKQKFKNWIGFLKVWICNLNKIMSLPKCIFEI